MVLLVQLGLALHRFLAVLVVLVGRVDLRHLLVLVGLERVVKIELGLRVLRVVLVGLESLGVLVVPLVLVRLVESQFLGFLVHRVVQHLLVVLVVLVVREVLVGKVCMVVE